LAHNASDTTSIITIKDITAGTADDDDDITLTGGSLATITLNVNSASTFDDFDVAGASAITVNATAGLTLTEITTTSTVATVTVTGAGTVDLGTLGNGIDTLTATSQTTGLTVVAAASNVGFVANLGSGNDVVTTGDTDFVTANAYNIDAGTGTDTLVIGADDDVDTALIAGRYDNFEIIRSGTSVDMALVSGIVGLEVSASTAKDFTEMTAAQAADITILGNITTSVNFSLANATGSSDTATLNLTSATSTTNITTAGLSFDDIETLNIVAGSGTNGTDTTVAFLADTVDELTDVNISGTADVHFDVIASTFDVSAVDIDASGLTGDGHFEYDLSATGLIKGSTVTGSANADTFNLGTTLGSTYNGGAGNDVMTAAVALFVADGTDDSTFALGAGTDTLNITGTAVTLADNHFTNVTGAEAITFAGTLGTNTGNISVTTGGAFTSAFSEVTVTATQIDTATFTWNGGLYNGDTSITLTTAGVGNATDEDITINTGDGADTVLINATTWLGATGDSSAISVSTDAGNDTIRVTTGNIAASVTGEVITIDAGAGADTITIGSLAGTSTTVQSAANIVVESGDSTTTAYDKITGFVDADGTDLSMEIQFDGTAAVTDFTNTSDYGVIKSHTATSGLASFDDIESYTTALVINSSNLADVCGYLAANTDTNDVTMFLYDSNSSGANDATMIFHNYTTDSLIQLSAVTSSTALTATATLVTANNLVVT